MRSENTPRVVTDAEYYSMSHESYANIRIGKVIEDDDGQVRWEVIDKLDDENGAQGIAVAPLDKNNKVDTSQIVIAYRGTVPKHRDGDITADVLQVALGIPYIPTEIETALGDFKTLTTQNQFQSALAFSDRVSGNFKNANISYTGHSLGGAEAQYVGAERDRKAVTFAAPNAYGLLSDEAKKKVDAGKTRESIRDYIHEDDVLGNFKGLNPLIGKQYYVASNEHAYSFWGNPVAGHGIATYSGMFNKGDGSIQFRMEPEAVIKAVKAFRPSLELIKDWRIAIEHYIEDEAQAVREIYSDMMANVNGSGKYPLLSEQDVIHCFLENAMTVKGSDYYFIDVDLAIDFCRKLMKYEQEMERFLVDLIQAAETTGTLDKEISTWFGR
jgi:hypothetical protein